MSADATEQYATSSGDSTGIRPGSQLDITAGLARLILGEST